MYKEPNPDRRFWSFYSERTVTSIFFFGKVFQSVVFKTIEYYSTVYYYYYYN